MGYKASDAKCLIKLSSDDFFKVYSGEFSVSQTASHMWTGRISVKPFGISSASFIKTFVNSVNLFIWPEFYEARKHAFDRRSSLFPCAQKPNLMLYPSLQELVSSLTGTHSAVMRKFFESFRERALIPGDEPPPNFILNGTT